MKIYILSFSPKATNQNMHESKATNIFRDASKVCISLFHEDCFIKEIPTKRTGLFFDVTVRENETDVIRCYILSLKPKGDLKLSSLSTEMEGIVELEEPKGIMGTTFMCEIDNRFEDLTALIDEWIDEDYTYKFFGYDCHRWSLDSSVQLITRGFVDASYNENILGVVHSIGEAIQNQAQIVCNASLFK